MHSLKVLKVSGHKLKEAMGGVLFIDEAYTLASDSFGKEAIDTLVTDLENYRDLIINYKREKFAELVKSRDELEQKDASWYRIMKEFYKDGHVMERKNLVDAITRIPEQESTPGHRRRRIRRHERSDHAGGSS